MLRINRVAQPVTVLGPGRRLGLWVQGCRIHCVGCASTDTWDPLGGRSVEVKGFAAELAKLVVTHELTGLTITGGEPTEQAEPLAELVRQVRELLAAPQSGRSPSPLDVLVFTGLAAGTAARRAAPLWAVADAAVCGPYRPVRPSPAPLIASANQRLVLLTSLGRERHAVTGAPRSSVQAHVDGGDITLIGLPKPGDLPLLEAALLARGVTLEGRSWKTP